MPITALPTAPSKINDSAAEFALKADAWVAALATFTTQANVLETNVNAKEVAATASASAASASAVAAAASAATALAAPGTNATSTTSRALMVGATTLTTQSGKSFVAGMRVLIARVGYTATHFMYATVTGYSSTLLSVTVEGFVGTGTYADWVISITGPASSIAAGSGITVDTANKLQPTVAHSNTSSQSSVNNSGATVIQDVTLDDYGHVTAAGSVTLTAATVGALPVAGGTMAGAITLGSYALKYDATSYLLVEDTGFSYLQNGYTEYFSYDTANGRLLMACANAGGGKGLQVSHAGNARSRFYGSTTGAYIWGYATITFVAASATILFDGTNGYFYPTSSVHLGSPTQAWVNIYYSGTLNDISDERLKDISPVFPEYSWVYDLNPIEFTWKDKDNEGKRKVGFSAQQVYEALPDELKDVSTVVTKTLTEDGEDYNWSMSKVDLVPYLVKIIQDHKRLIDTLMDKVSELEKNN